MCGVAGVFAYDKSAPPVSREELLRIRDSMIRRGPDDAGLWVSSDQRVGLAHRRLAIIDLDARATQPMHDPETGNVIVFNGEIYNYCELKQALEAKGIMFRTQSDTEVLLKLYALHGEDMMRRLRGMFAFAIWDARTMRLFLARDPFGIKPLYFADDGKTFRFSSQVKALLSGGAVSGSPSAAGVVGFFIWGHVPEPWTWALAVRALPAGSILTVALHRGIPAPRPYFDLREEILAAEAAPKKVRDDVTETTEMLAESVGYHLVADVPVGVFLSAGRDSTLISTLAAGRVSEPLRTLTLGFDEFRGRIEDEVPVAEKVAAVIGARHTTARIANVDFEAELEKLFDAMDQPSIDGVNTYFVSRAAAASGLKVALSGLGGDELFGGYQSFYLVPRIERILRPLRGAPWFGASFRAFTAPLARWGGLPKAAGLFEYGTSLPKAYLLRRALYMPWELMQVTDPAVVREGFAELAVQDELRSRIAGIRNPVLAVMALEMSSYMRNQLLRDADWAGMAHSLEIRVPLVDVELFRKWLPLAAHNLPFNRQLLLEAVDRRIAGIVGQRPKTGFAVPVQAWLKAMDPHKSRAVRMRAWARMVAQRFAPETIPFLPKVLLTDAFGGIGGIARFNRDLLGALAAIPECLQVEALPRLVQREPEQIPPRVLYRFDTARGKLSYTLAALRLALDGSAASVVICGHLNLLPLAWLVSSIKQSPLLLIAHGIEAWHPHKSVLVRRLLCRVDRLICVSRHTADRIAGWSGFPPDRISILPNCVDLEAFQPRPRNAQVAGHYGLDGRRVLLTVGRLSDGERYKGFDEVIEMLPDLAREHPDLAYVIVGDGDDRPRLEQKAKALSVSERVVFTGFVSEEEKKELYALADAFVMPGRKEGFGIVYLEAMACGVPVIGSLLDGSREALCDGRLGQLVDPREPQQLVYAIRKALDAPRGRPPGLEYFSSTAFYERVARLMREIIKFSRVANDQTQDCC